ncbi:hypothetical protein NQ318_004054 [Aromia moschata]|uniref:Uncharacterized protein n=1 Tax=Aromia moschata TaxID=1265417 RepID=A0AAV8ZAG6_9CUCU|nr:hypothetical protein NQ318_004054 [Aromia moschata]
MPNKVSNYQLFGSCRPCWTSKIDLETRDRLLLQVIHVLVRYAQLKELLLLPKVCVKTQKSQLVTEYNNLMSHISEEKDLGLFAYKLQLTQEKPSDGPPHKLYLPSTSEQLTLSAGPMDPFSFLPSQSTHQQTSPFLLHCLGSNRPSVVHWGT